MPRLVPSWIVAQVITEVGDGCHRLGDESKPRPRRTWTGTRVFERAFYSLQLWIECY
jgi:hypothetical protein